MIKKCLAILSMLIFSFAMASEGIAGGKENVKVIANKVAEWQIANFGDNSYVRYDRHPLHWANGALYRGMLEWAQKTGFEPAEKFVYDIGKKMDWRMAKRMYHADDICVGQSFLMLYDKYKDEAMLKPVKERADSVIEFRSDADLNFETKRALDRWSWCDALFMAPPVYAELSRITGDRKYLDFMEEEFLSSTNYLFDNIQNLYFRDSRFFGQKEENGADVFWGRGNGWCYAGLTFLLETVPVTDPMYAYFKSLYLKMTEAVLATQDENGSWHASLLAPLQYSSPENSASGFMTYGLAWGANHGILKGKTYRKAALKGWNALCSYVSEDGKLQYVQLVAGSPEKIEKDMTEVYGVGAFLLAASEIIDF